VKSILAVAKDEAAIRVLEKCFSATCKMTSVATKENAFERLRERRSDFLFIDLQILLGSLSGNDYKAALQPFWHLYPSIQVIVMSSQDMIREAVMAVKAGASNYVTYPLNPEEVKYVVESTYESLIVQSELDYLRDRFWQSDSLDIVQTKSLDMKQVFDKIRSVAPTKSTVLLMGETGTGKGVLAKLIHRHSNRKEQPFISVHCGAIPDTLLESELFGHEKGAFTGAVRRKLGKFEIAKGGTIFLDEIGTITPSAQIKLLQVLQDGIFHRVGGEETIDANVRVIAATNTDLKKLSDDGQFRKDLYYRLNVFPIRIPSLAERKIDVPLFVDLFLKKLNKTFPKEIHDVHPQVLEALKNYSWPGNIRELENLLERAYILESSPMLNPMSFPSELFESAASNMTSSTASFLTLAEARRRGIAELERRYLKELLAKNKGKIKESADAGGISTRQLHKLMKKYELRKEDFKSPMAS